MASKVPLEETPLNLHQCQAINSVLDSVHLPPDISAVPAERKTTAVRGSMNVETMPFEQLDQDALRFWLNSHQHDSQYRSPNFHPKFTEAVSRVRNDVCVAVIRNGAGNLTGVFPYQRWGEGCADPVGGRMNDYHGILTAPEARIELGSLFLRLGISKFGFHAVSVNKSQFSNYQFSGCRSFGVNLTGEFQPYINWVTGRSQTIRRLPQKIRALHRDHGPVRFEFDCGDSCVLEKLIQLKRDKYVRTNTFDILSVDWAANLLRQINRYCRSDFRGILSVLWAGEKIVAAHFGMIANHVLQYWFPAFDAQYSKYSPGLQLMVKTIEHACDFGISRIDLSYGQSKFKDMFANDEEEVLFGKVIFNPVAFQVARQRYRLRMRLRDLPFKDPAKYLLRKVFPEYGRWHFK